MAIVRKQLMISLDPEAVDRIERLKYRDPEINGDVSKLIRMALKLLEREMDNPRAIEILGERTHPRGEFNPVYTDKLVRRDGKTYLIHWMFGGLDTLRGGAVRPYLFDVRQDQLPEIMPYFTPGADVLAAHYDHDVIGSLEWCREIPEKHWARDI